MNGADLFLSCVLVLAVVWLVTEWRAETGRRNAETARRVERARSTRRQAERQLVADVERWLREGAK